MKRMGEQVLSANYARNMVSRSLGDRITMIEVQILTHLQACASFVYNYIQTLLHCDTIILFIQLIVTSLCNSSQTFKKLRFTGSSFARETQVSLIQIYDQECEHMWNFLLVAVVCKESLFSYLCQSGSSSLTLCEDSKMLRTFHSQIREKIFTSHRL